MLDHVLPADVDDECDFRLERRNVREVLLRSHAKIYAATLNRLVKSRNDGLITRFIRKKIVGSKITAGLREVDDHLPEFPVRKAGRKRIGSDRRAARDISEETEEGERRAREEYRSAFDVLTHNSLFCLELKTLSASGRTSDNSRQTSETLPHRGWVIHRGRAIPRIR